MARTETGEPRSRAEVEQAIADLTESDIVKLEDLAEQHVWCLGRSAKGGADLLQEAILRTLRGKRVWRSNVDLIRHLDQAMRSIANSWCKADKDAPNLQSEIAAVSESGEEWDPYSAVASHTDLEQVVVDKDRFDRLVRQLKSDLHQGDDSVSLEILEHFHAGFEPKDIMESLSISRSVYEAQVKKLRRYAQKIIRSDQHG